MKIGLYNLEPKYKNLALEKVRIYYQGIGHKVEDYFALERYDEIWCSSIFSWTPKDGRVPDGAIVGGTGFNETIKLPTDIDLVKPRLSFGFTTRGCIRKCKFCVVPQKEGTFRIIGNLYDLWDGKSREIILYDNNILASVSHFRMICQESIKMKIILDFNQGLDHRLLNQEVIDIIKTIKHKELRFAFDHPNLEQSVDTAINLLQINGINRCFWYVLVGFNTTIDEDLYRLNLLRDRGQTVFVQRYNRSMDKRLIAISRWANQHNVFKAMSWRQYLNHPDSIKRKRHLLFT